MCLWDRWVHGIITEGKRDKRKGKRDGTEMEDKMEGKKSLEEEATVKEKCLELTVLGVIDNLMRCCDVCQMKHTHALLIPYTFPYFFYILHSIRCLLIFILYSF